MSLSDITIIRQSESWQGEQALFALTGSALEVLGTEITVPEAQSLAVVFTDDASIRDMNHQFRGKDAPTNVLSFPSDEEEELGDIILAYETIEKEAAEQRKSFDNHLTHLLIHGILHLLGYDHSEEDEARDMESLEIRILAKLDIANPYETR